VCKHFYEPEPFVKPLEKIEMKKTLVAVAAIAAVTGAMADATIYGLMEQAYRADKATMGTAATNSKKGLDAVVNGGMSLGFKGSEDLGNGITASFVTEIGFEPSDPYTAYTAAGGSTLTGGAGAGTVGVSNGVNNRQSFVGLAGGFGSVTLGRQYSNIFLAACGYDIGGCANMAGNLAIIAASDASTDVRRANAINYTLPTLVSGLTVQVGKAFGESVKVGASATNNAGDSSSYTLGYATGPFSVTLASETTDNTGNFGNYGNKAAASTTSKRKTTVTGLSYDAGVAKLNYTNTKAAVGVAKTTGTVYGVSVPFGAASIGYEAGTGNTSSTSATGDALKSSQLAFNYSLSKRTTAYLRQGSLTETASGANVAKLSTTAIGVMHSF